MRVNSVEQKGYANRIMDWKIFVRQDLVAAKASEFFYEFVGENSFRPVSELLLPEDGELLKKAVEADTFQPLELITVLHNLKDSVRNVYLLPFQYGNITALMCLLHIPDQRIHRPFKLVHGPLVDIFIDRNTVLFDQIFKKVNIFQCHKMTVLQNALLQS